MDPDPGGPKTCGSGSGTLKSRMFVLPVCESVLIEGGGGMLYRNIGGVSEGGYRGDLPSPCNLSFFFYFSTFLCPFSCVLELSDLCSQSPLLIENTILLL
jgi:hypothetical protein